MARILILDGDQRSALAAVRSLGRKSHTVLVASDSLRPIAGSSKYCYKSISYTAPSDCPTDFIANLQDIVSLYNIEALIPMTDVTVPLVIQSATKLPDIKTPLPNYESYVAASNKFELFQMAERMQVPTPRTEYFEAWTGDPVDTGLRYPVVIKPARSRLLHDGRIVETRVMFAEDKAALGRILGEQDWLRQHPFMLQEKIKGEGQGVFAVYKNGRPVTFFAHRRLREKPPQGGVSVLSESCEPEPRMRKIAEMLLTELHWHGAAMVEFKVDEDGTPYLMEINGRLWGSLQLAISAGFDVPEMLLDLALDREIRSSSSITAGIRNRWLLGDLDHLILQLRGKGTAKSIQDKLICLLRFLNFFDRRCQLEVFRWNDPKPFLVELRNWLGALAK